MSEIDKSDAEENTRPESAAGSSPPLSEIGSAAVSQLTRRKKPWYTNIIILLLTVGLFFSIGMLTFGVLSIVLLLIVLAVHELGHYYAMKTLGYTNLRPQFRQSSR